MADFLKEKYDTVELLNSDFNFSTEAAFENLKSDKVDDFTKVFSIISLNNLINFENTFLLFQHLTNHANPIREAAAFKIAEFGKNCPVFYLDEKLNDFFLNGIIDINPNVSRSICNVFSNFKELREIYEPKIIEKTRNLIEEIKKTEKETDTTFLLNSKNKKSHAKNKKIFALYWLLEAISVCLTNKNNKTLVEILNCTINFHDYTIREKTAKIASKMEPFEVELLKKAEADVNFYVKNQVYDKINEKQINRNIL